MRTTVIAPPEPLVTWEEAEAHLRLDGDEDQSELVERMIAAACGHIDGPKGWLNRSIGVQTLESVFSPWKSDRRVRLYGDIIDLISVKYLTAQNVEVVAELEDFIISGGDLYSEGSEFVWWGGSLRQDAVRIRYRAGYVVDPTDDPLVPDVPEPIRQAVLMMVGDMWHSRASVATGTAMNAVPVSATVADLLQPYRVYW